jgi:hypothetical protein
MTNRNKSKDQKSRSNVTTACTNCQIRKVRCSGSHPCANCVKHQKHDECNFTSPYRRRGPKKRMGEIITSGKKRLLTCYQNQNYTTDRQSFQETNFFSNFFGSSELYNFPNIVNDYYYIHTNQEAPP